MIAPKEEGGKEKRNEAGDLDGQVCGDPTSLNRNKTARI